MKILRLSTFLDFGGVETRLANISHIRDENEWVFLCINNEGRSSEIIKKNQKRVVNIHSKPSIYSIKTFWRIYKTIKKENPNVIHTSGAEANFHGILAAKFAGVPIIVGEEIGIPNHSKKAQLIFSFVYRFADYVIGNSKAVLDAVHRLDSVPKHKLVKIDNPIIFNDLAHYKKNENFKDEFRIIMISRLEAVKNIEGVIKSIAKLIKEGYTIKLTIAGNGTSETDLKKMVKSLDLESFVKFIGFINDPYPYLIDSDLYVLNSFSEGFSNSLIEAMYSGTPALSTFVGAAPEIINDSDNGFLVPIDDQALYEKLKAIILLPVEKREEIGAKGNKTVVDNFSLENHINSLYNVYQ